MTTEEVGKGFVTGWAIRILWLLVIMGIGMVAGEGRIPAPLILSGTVAIIIQFFILMLWVLKRLPSWQAWLSALVSGAVGSLALWSTPESLAPLLLLALVPFFDIASSEGWMGLVLLAVYPFPVVAVLIALNNVPPETSLTYIVAWLLVAVAGAIYISRAREAADKPPVVIEPAVPDTLYDKTLTEVAALLIRESKYDRILDVLVRRGCALLDGGSRSSRAKAMAFTFKPGLHDVLRVAAHHNMDQIYVEQSYDLEGVLAILLRDGEPIDTTAETPPFDRMRGIQAHRVLLFPLRTGLDVYGAVMFAVQDRSTAANERVQRVLIGLADLTSMALHNAVLQSELLQDRHERLGGEGDARHQLARDLHDGPVQRVAAISMQLEFLKALMKRHPERALEELEQLQEVARTASQEMRTMLFSLRPVVLESEGLAAALETFIERLRNTDKLDIRFSAEPLPRLDDKVEEVAFAILQEAINNAKKYASHKPIHVRLVKGQEMVIGQVKDNGPGFDLKAVTSNYGTRASLGLLNMRERAEMVGGVLKIDTAPGSGTTISVAVPFELE